jgi:hypothetical protein
MYILLTTYSGRHNEWQMFSTEAEAVAVLERIKAQAAGDPMLICFMPILQQACIFKADPVASYRG